jgi:UDP-N-acetylmuramate dehydrogenase
MNQLKAEKIEQLKAALPGVTENEPMAKHTSFRAGGPARLYYVAETSDAMLAAMQTAKRFDIPWRVYGGGSNLLVSDDGYEGLLIQAANRDVTIEGETVKAEAGAITVMVARKSVDAGLAGFEWATGVPGTIGGALYGNAGCFGGEMKDTVTSVAAYHVASGEQRDYSNAECQFGYRESLFKREPHIILGCEMRLSSTGDIEAGKKKIAEIIEKRKETQPLGKSTCGSVFKNYDFKDESELEILKRSIEFPVAMLQNKRLSAGWLIEQVGMRGHRIGDIQVSEKHGNFFENHGNARAQDILALISYVKMKVRDELGIELQEEVQLLGF